MQKILIANRGEIAVRILKTAKKMQIKTLLVYAPADADAAYLKEADEAILLKGKSLQDTYLNSTAIITAARENAADAIHPGYGFLSENPAFARACKSNNITFIGPPAEAIEAMGNKIAARQAAVQAGVPVTPGITGSIDTLLKNYSSIPFPLLIKAAAGGGGKGMRVVNSHAELQAALEATAREAKSYFGDETVYIEKYVNNPRHIEVQVLGDTHGNLIHLYERECSLQRRHQKIIEEAPSPTLNPHIRKKICLAATQLANAIGYQSAGTLEFLLGPDLDFYFLEMNTRIQVEHPVTELTTGLDIVEQQIRVARGEKLSIQQQDVHQRGHAIECRIYAEDPEQDFLPSPGKISYYKEPLGEDIRVDGMLLQKNAVISGDFDPMISKLITWGKNRESALKRMVEALDHYFIQGIQNNIAFLQGLLLHADFSENRFSTKYIDNNLNNILQYMKEQKAKEPVAVPLTAALLLSLQPTNSESKSIWNRIGYWRFFTTRELMIDQVAFSIELKKASFPAVVFTFNAEQIEASLEYEEQEKYGIHINGLSHSVQIIHQALGAYFIRYKGFDYFIQRTDLLHTAKDDIAPPAVLSAASGAITAPMPGKVIKIAVEEGSAVQKGELLLVVEAMKMENNILSPYQGTVTQIKVNENDKVDTNTVLIDIKQS